MDDNLSTMGMKDSRHTRLILQAAMDLMTFDYRDILTRISSMEKDKQRGRYLNPPSPQLVIQVLRHHKDIVMVQEATSRRTKVYKYVGDYADDREELQCNY